MRLRKLAVLVARHRYAADRHIQNRQYVRSPDLATPAEYVGTTKVPPPIEIQNLTTCFRSDQNESDEFKHWHSNDWTLLCRSLNRIRAGEEPRDTILASC